MSERLTSPAKMRYVKYLHEYKLSHGYKLSIGKAGDVLPVTTEHTVMWAAVYHWGTASADRRSHTVGSVMRINHE